MKTRGSVWVSAILYIGLGLVVISLLLTAGLPVINKIKDKNTFTQTKALFFKIDKNIIDVINEGPGSRRLLNPLEITQGDLIIDGSDENKIKWSMETSNLLMDPGYVREEGNLKVWLTETNVKENYVINLELDYFGTAVVDLSSDYDNPFRGSYSVVIENTGDYDSVTGKPKISIEVN